MRIHLRSLFSTVMVVPVIGVSAFVAFVSYFHGQAAIRDVVVRLHGEEAVRIENHLDEFLNSPVLLNRISAGLIGRAGIDARDPAAIQRYCLELVRGAATVTSVYFGNVMGGIAGAGREGSDGSLYLTETAGFTAGVFRKYAVDEKGRRGPLLAEVPDFDARGRPWYVGAVTRNGAAWTRPYMLSTGQDIAVAASQPVLERSGILVGVVSIDLFLSHFGEFMRGLTIGKSGAAFIIERSGQLIASSTGERLLEVRESDGSNRRKLATESAVPIVQGAAEHLIREFGSFSAIGGSRPLEFQLNDRRHFLQVNPIRGKGGLDWLIVVVIPESDFMERLEADTAWTALLVLAAMLFTGLIGLVLAQCLAGPILRLDAATRAFAEGTWREDLSPSWMREIDDLSRTFNLMARRMNLTMVSLNQEIGERQQAEAAMREAEEKLRRLLEFKETMLKELQHRVKNNLNIVASLLKLEMPKLIDPGAQAVFADAQSRIHSMSMIYEQLNKADGVETVDLDRYLRNLIDSISASYMADPGMNAITARLAPMQLDLKRSVSLGLILNELLTNAAKYAYRAGEAGEIVVDLAAEDGRLCLRVRDRGRGLPDGFDLEGLDSLGLRLVGMLTEQIGGELSIAGPPGQGTTASVCFRL